ncbi:MAG: AzlD domain-containing protein [Gudongella sp.]|jgi:branched-subunit amino acid transport protein|nr:AzlD domain-containing protein [Gudongella sp.]
MNSFIPAIIGMALVTYFPKTVPMILLKEIKLSKKANLFLRLIPYTSLSILIIRGILTTNSAEIPAALVGIAVSGAVAYWKDNLILAVFTGIIASLIMLHI